MICCHGTRADSSQAGRLLTTRSTSENSKGLDAFVSAKFEVAAMLDRLAALSGSHLGTDRKSVV